MVAHPNGKRLDFNRFFLRQMLGKARGNGVGKTGADTNNGVSVFNGLAGFLCARNPAVSANKTALLLIKKPFAH